MNNSISAFIGALIAIMIMFNGTLSNITGKYTSSVIIHITGLLSIMLVLLLSKSKIKFKKDIPIYLYSAGIIGVFTVVFNNLSFVTIGASLTIALGLFGQSVASIIVDHFGILGMKITKFEKKKYIGLLLISLGIFIMTVF